jgi:hypothetical protein
MTKNRITVSGCIRGPYHWDYSKSIDMTAEMYVEFCKGPIYVHPRIEMLTRFHEQALAMNEEYDMQHGVNDAGQTKTERSL